MAKPVIFTHMRVDIDAVLSVLALRAFTRRFRHAQVAFVPASWNEVMPLGAIALDLEAGGQGIKGERDEDGTTHSCFATVLERFGAPKDKLALSGLARLVDLHDSTGIVFQHVCPGLEYELSEALECSSLFGVFRSFKAEYGREQDGDMRVLEAMKPIFHGILHNERMRVEASVLIDEKRWIHILPGGKVACVDNVQNHRVSDVLVKKYGVRAIVSLRGNNLSVYRCPDETRRMDAPSVRSLVEEVGETDQWFAHPSGFLFAHGTPKSPASQPSQVDPLRLAETVNALFDDL